MRKLSASERKSLGEVALQVLNFLDISQERSVELGLVGSLLLNGFLGILRKYGLALEERALIGLLLWLGDSLSGEIGIIDFASVDAIEADGGAGGLDVGLVDSSERDTVDLVWAGDQEEAALQLLQENNSASFESAAEEDDDASWSQSLPELGWLWSSVGSHEVGLLIVSSVEELGSSALCLSGHS